MVLVNLQTYRNTRSSDFNSGYSRRAC